MSKHRLDQSLCPDCNTTPDEPHDPRCPRVFTTAQIGPPWIPLEEAKPWCETCLVRPHRHSGKHNFSWRRPARVRRSAAEPARAGRHRGGRS